MLYRRILVDKKMVTSIGSSYDPISYGISTFGIYFQPAPNVKIADIEKEIDKIINEITEKVIPEDVVRTSKDRLINSATYARDSLQYPAMIFGRAITAGFDIEYIESWTENIEKVTAEEIQKAAIEVFKGKNKPVVGILMPKENSK